MEDCEGCLHFDEDAFIPTCDIKEVMCLDGSHYKKDSYKEGYNQAIEDVKEPFLLMKNLLDKIIDNPEMSKQDIEGEALLILHHPDILNNKF